MKRAAVLIFFAIAARGYAQETGLQADFRHEKESFDESCAEFKIAGCGQLLFTGHPLHIAVGSLAPLNGFGAGVAFTAHYTPNEDWRLFWDADAVATPNGSWRAGGYMTAVLIRHPKISVVTGGANTVRVHSPAMEMPVFHVSAQTTSLNEIAFYGLGQGTPRSPSFFGMTNTVAGADVVWPLLPPLNISLLGEANGRFYSIRGSHVTAGPSLEQSGTEAAAPGLLREPSYAQFGEGIRIRPSLAGGRVRLNYTAKFQEWIAGQSGFSFRRLSADLSHEFPLYRTSPSLSPRDFNGPDDCSSGPNSQSCPTLSRNLEGSFGFRVIYTSSATSRGNVVPFYLDPTIGGTDVNGTTLLPSYPDYRFRGPDLLVVRGSFEHSLGKLPIGAKFLVDAGRVALRADDVGSGRFAHSYAAGLTVHAGGLPVVDLLFAWGGGEGTHTIANVSPSLLGGTARPPIY